MIAYIDGLDVCFVGLIITVVLVGTFGSIFLLIKLAAYVGLFISDGRRRADTEQRIRQAELILEAQRLRQPKKPVENVVSVQRVYRHRRGV